jgi:hypothetical protein
MTSGIFRKIGRALSIFGVSSPEDLAERERIRALRNVSRVESEPPPNPPQQPSIERTDQK